MSPETAIYQYLQESVEQAAADSPLFGVEVFPTVYHRSDALCYVRIGNCESSLSPHSYSMIEQDAVTSVEILSRVSDDSDAAEFVTAREKVRAVQLAVAKLLIDDSTLGGRVCDSILLDSTRSWGSVKTQKNAVALLPLVINPTGSLSA